MSIKTGNTGDEAGRLVELNTKATQGKWRLFGEALMLAIFGGKACVASHVLESGEDNWENDAPFIVALVNAYRSGASFPTKSDDARNPDPSRAVAFGYGRLVVDTGTFHERPAVFIAPTNRPGPVGASVPKDEQGDLNALESGEHVLTFPTIEQARFVADAMMGRASRDEVEAKATTPEIDKALDKLRGYVEAYPHAADEFVVISPDGFTLGTMRALLENDRRQRETISRKQAAKLNLMKALDEQEAILANLFDRLHIESMTREWFDGPSPNLDGYLSVLRKRLNRATALRATPTPPAPGRDAVEAMKAKALEQISYWQERMFKEKYPEDGISEDGETYTPIGDEAARRAGYCNGWYSSSHWWLQTIDALASADTRQTPTRDRHTFEVPPGHVAVFDAGGRATGETRPSADTRQGDGAVLREVAAERGRQKAIKGWSTEHDDEHNRGEIAMAACVYAGLASAPSPTRHHALSALWPWSLDSLKQGNPRRNLVKAAALAVAEIERLDRAALTPSAGGK